MSQYLKTVYNYKDRPLTKYPDYLIEYLISRCKLKKGAAILELGCGRGDFIAAFANAGMNVTAVDLADEFPAELRNSRKSQREIFYGGINLESDILPFENDSFDVVFSKSVLEHLQNPEHYIKESKRVLKSGGILILMVPDWQSTQCIFYDDYTHVHPYTKVGVEDLLKIFNFKNLTVEKFYQLPIVWKYPAIKIVCWFLQRLGPVKKLHKNKFYRFSKELMILAIGRKGKY